MWHRTYRFYSPLCVRSLQFVTLARVVFARLICIVNSLLALRSKWRRRRLRDARSRGCLGGSPMRRTMVVWSDAARGGGLGRRDRLTRDGTCVERRLPVGASPGGVSRLSLVLREIGRRGVAAVAVAWRAAWRSAVVDVGEQTIPSSNSSLTPSHAHSLALMTSLHPAAEADAACIFLYAAHHCCFCTPPMFINLRKAKAMKNNNDNNRNFAKLSLPKITPEFWATFSPLTVRQAPKTQN